MFICIKFGDCSEFLVVNPDCNCKAFIAYLRRKIALIEVYENQNEDEGPWYLDLCDETGVLFDLPEKPAIENLSSLFEFRGFYIPVLITKTSEGGFKNIVPLVEDITADVDRKLKRYLRSRGKPSRDDSKNSNVSTRQARKLEKSDYGSRRDITSPGSDRKEKRNKPGLNKPR